ncbi:hypothetical protein HHK36_022324 [Tetracentron sinense]|uniref:Uncharacterized protein n=1 Tax=Tetracentron sinense TaxID=13715 RepID=A0A835D9H5_TETSI|nr:hypothetical protein HHK36_022324 [Tetracentron sinense]
MAVLNCANMVAVYTMWILMTYLTDVWKLSITHAATIVNVYSGLVGIMPIVMAFLLDHCLGTYWMLFLSSVTYSIVSFFLLRNSRYHRVTISHELSVQGLSFLAMSTPPVLSKVTGTCSAYEPACIGHIQSIFFYVALALTAVGKSSHFVSVESFWKLQNENQEQEENQTNPEDGLQKLKKMVSYVSMLPLVAALIAVAFIKPWSIRFGIPAIFTVVATLMFLSSLCSNTFIKPPQTSGISTGGAAVITVPSHLIEEYHNNRLRFVGARGADETRVTLRIIPMWTTFIVCGILISVGNTYFLEQANHMNNKLGSLHVPVVFLFLYYNMLKWGNDQSFENLMTKNPAAVLASSPIFYSIICCIIAALVESKRLHVVKKYGLIDKPEDTIPMSMFWLLPQLFFLAFMEYSAGKIFAKFCVQEVPDSMKRYVPYMTEGVLGAGTIGSVLLVYIVNKVSKRGGRLSWFQDTLNKSRLDNYYWLLTVLSSINFVVYFFLISWFKIRSIRPR